MTTTTRTVRVIEPDGTEFEQGLPLDPHPQLTAIQEILEGYLASAGKSRDGNLVMYVDEEGSFKPHLLPNPRATALLAEWLGVPVNTLVMLVGRAVVMELRPEDFA